MPKLNERMAAPTPPTIVNLRCRSCHRLGSFGGLHNINDLGLSMIVHGPEGQVGARQCHLGLRVCPNPDCKEILFITADNHGNLVSYPPQRIDFEADDIPPRILASFEEAIADHANQCFRSAAIMVRRTLEEICADRSATGKNLKERLRSLSSLIVVPKELIEAADELRLLGNDAAHLEAQIYDEIANDEVEAAIGLCKEILKAVYQLSSLVHRLRSLKKQP